MRIVHRYPVHPDDKGLQPVDVVLLVYLACQSVLRGFILKHCAYPVGQLLVACVLHGCRKGLLPHLHVDCLPVNGLGGLFAGDYLVHDIIVIDKLHHVEDDPLGGVVVAKGMTHLHKVSHGIVLADEIQQLLLGGVHAFFQIADYVPIVHQLLVIFVAYPVYVLRGQC